MDTYKTVTASSTIITELMIPSYSNFGGNIHGGIILSLMDKAAYVCATKHAETYCVTAAIDTVDFLSPVAIGDLVSIHTSVNYVGNSSMVIGMRVIAESVKTRIKKHTNTSYFTMIAVGEDHKPVQVPGLRLQSETEVRRFYEALHRKELKKYYRQEESRPKTDAEKADFMELLKKERCVIEIDGQ